MLAVVAPEGKKVRVEEVDGMVWVYVVDHHTLTADFDELVAEGAR